MDAPGKTDAAVLVPLYERDGELVAVFTERRADLRKHAGEISFPGGRQDLPDEDLRETALREAEEEIGLRRSDVELVGALPPVGTFVTGYRVFPFVGSIEPDYEWSPQATEVERVLELSLPDLVRGYESKRLIRKGVPDQDPDLHRRRPPRLGRHRANGAVPAGAACAAAQVVLTPAQTSFSIGTFTRLPHSVHEPS